MKLLRLLALIPPLKRGVFKLGPIKDGKIAKEKIALGADIIVTGTIVERDTSVVERIIRNIRW